MKSFSTDKMNNGELAGRSRLRNILIVLLVLELCALVVLSTRLMGSGSGQRKVISLTEGGAGTTVTITDREQSVPKANNGANAIFGEGVLIASTNGYLPTPAVTVASATGSSSSASFKASDTNGKVWETDTQVDIFRIHYDNNGDAKFTVESGSGDKVLAPGTDGTYSFTLANTGKTQLKYTLTFVTWMEGQSDFIPVEGRLSDGNGNYLSGSASSWTAIKDFNSVTDTRTVEAGKSVDYNFDWQWPFERDAAGDAEDTLLGNKAAAGTDIILHVRIMTRAEAEELPEVSVTNQVIGPDGNPVDPSKPLKTGDTVTINVSVTNNGTDTLKDVVVTDALTGQTWTIPELKPGQTAVKPLSYTVTVEDAEKGSITSSSTVTAQNSNPADPPVTVTSDPVTQPIKAPITSVKVEESITKEDGTPIGPDDKLNPGDTIKVTVDVTNDGDYPLTDIDVTDPLTGKTWHIDELKPGESVHFESTYTVTEEDTDKGSITAQAEVTAKSPDKNNPTIDEKSNKVEVPVEDNRHADVKVTEQVLKDDGTPLKDGDTLKPGDTVTVKVHVENNGTDPIKNVVVTDSLTGKTWTIPELKPGESVDFETSYTITGEDANKGSVTSQATVTGEPRNKGDKPVNVTSDKVTVPVNKPYEGGTEPGPTPRSSITVDTEILSGDGPFKPGDTIDYRITVTNDGDTDQYNVTVVDTLTGRTYTIPHLAPGESAVFNGSYTISDADSANGSVTGTVRAYVDGTPMASDSFTARTGPTPVSKVDITTKIISGDGPFQPGDVIEYEITATNTGNQTLYNVTVVDEITGRTWVIPKLEPGESVTYKVSYTVTEDDAKRGSISGRIGGYIGPADGTPDGFDSIQINNVKESEVVIIDPGETPTTDRPDRHWALLNLLAAAATIVIGAIELVVFLRGDKEDDEARNYGIEGTNEYRHWKKSRKRKPWDLVPVVASIVAFLLTEDITQPMVVADKWTILMAVLLAISVTIAVLTKMDRHLKEKIRDFREAIEKAGK